MEKGREGRETTERPQDCGPEEAPASGHTHLPTGSSPLSEPLLHAGLSAR